MHSLDQKTWGDIRTIYTDYTNQRGWFRKFFYSQSDFMAFIEDQLDGRLDASELNWFHRLDLLHAIFEIPLEAHNSLSYRLAKRMIPWLLGSTDQKFFETIQFLDACISLNAKSLERLVAYPDRNVLLNDLSTIKEYARLNTRDVNQQVFKKFNYQARPLEVILAEILKIHQEWTQATVWYRKAIEQYPQEAEYVFDLAELYRCDASVHQETVYAQYLKAALLGHRSALDVLLTQSNQTATAGRMLAAYYQERKNQALFLQYAKRAAIQGDLKSIHMLQAFYQEQPEHNDGIWYYHALAACQQDIASLERLKSGAESGNAQAQYGLGVDYFHTLKQTDEAIVWCLRAAQQGHTPAWNYLIETPFTVEQYQHVIDHYTRAGDSEKVVVFLKKASALGDAASAFRLGQLMELDNQIVLAVPFYQQAAQKGHYEASLAVQRLCPLPAPPRLPTDFFKPKYTSLMPLVAPASQGNRP